MIKKCWFKRWLTKLNGPKVQQPAACDPSTVESQRLSLLRETASRGALQYRNQERNQDPWLNSQLGVGKPANATIRVPSRRGTRRPLPSQRTHGSTLNLEWASQQVGKPARCNHQGALQFRNQETLAQRTHGSTLNLEWASQQDATIRPAR